MLFDRSWYNRAGVEKVMGFCTKGEYELFLEQTPVFERMLVDSGIILLKYWLAVDQKEQEERFAERAADDLKRWKLSPIDLKAREYYEEYGRARDDMFKATHTKHAPWFVVDFDDQRRRPPELDPPPAGSGARHQSARRAARAAAAQRQAAEREVQGPGQPIKGMF